jgi:hypothetical protein
VTGDKTIRAGRPRGHGKPWTTTELRKLRALYPDHSQKDCARILGRGLDSVKSKALVLHLKRNRNYRRWTAADIAELRRAYPSTWPRDLVRHFGRGITNIHAAAARHGIKKDPAFVRETGLISSRHPNVRASQFPKGHVPANKGLRRPGWFAGRMRETQFKKGNRPHDWLPVGTIQANADGYLRMKVRDDRGTSAGKGGSSTNWMFVHKMVWESAHGPIPPGHRIWWKDRNHLNCALENLELLTDQEHMARTTIHNLPPELKQVIQLNGALKRRIQRMEQHGEKQHLRPARPSL